MILRSLAFCLDRIDALKKQNNIAKDFYKKTDNEQDKQPQNNLKSIVNIIKEKENIEKLVKKTNDIVVYDFKNYVIYVYFPSFNTYAPFISPKSFISSVI